MTALLYQAQGNTISNELLQSLLQSTAKPLNKAGFIQLDSVANQGAGLLNVTRMWASTIHVKPSDIGMDDKILILSECVLHY